MNILFVCTGNMNRSPMAEALMRKLLSREGRKDIQVQSAGTHAFVGSQCPAEARRGTAFFQAGTRLEVKPVFSVPPRRARITVGVVLISKECLARQRTRGMTS